MVDALKRAQRMVGPAGTIVDVHPTAAPACVAVGAERLGALDAADAVLRHAAADAAVATLAAEAFFDVTAMVDFVYHTYGDTIDELRDYVAANWRNSRIGEDLVERTRRALGGSARGHRPRVVEYVRLTRWRPRPMA